MNKINKYVLAIAVVFLIIVSTIVSITFSFYTSEVKNNETIVGSTSNYDLELDVELYSKNATGGLVPQLSDTTYLTQALLGTNKKSCIDGNGNSVCQIYKITITNPGGSSVDINGTFSLIGDITGLKWEVLKDSTTLNEQRAKNDSDDTQLETNLTLKGKTSKEYYVVVWFEETGSAQVTKSTDKFTGVVSFEGTVSSVSSLINNKIYQNVEYIESSGKEYIDTGVKPDDTIVMQMKFTNLQSTGANIIGYVKESDTEPDSFRFFNYSENTYLDYGSGQGYNRVIGNKMYANTNYEVEVGNRYVKNLNNNTYMLNSSKVSFSEKNYDIYINGNNNYSKNRWYYLKIYKNNILVRDYIPSVRVSDNKPGLYDIKNDIFYINNGTGEFSVGKEID